MDQANDYVRDITSAFIKLACNRKVDDAGKTQKSEFVVAVESAPAKKKGGKKGGK